MSRFASWLLALTFALAPLEARAQTGEDLVDRGLEARQAGRDDEAADLFRRAYEATGTAEALAQLALAEQALGRWPDAEAHLAEALTRDEEFIRENRAVLEGALATIRAHLGQLFVEANVDGARVAIDGREVGTTPIRAPLHVPAGTVVVSVEADGYHRVTREATVSASGPPGRVSLTLVPIEERSIETPAEPEPVHERILAPAEPRPTEPSPQPRGMSPLLVAGIASAGVAVLSLGATIAAIVVREDNVSVYNDDSQCPPDAAMGGRMGACPDAYSAWRTAEDWAIAAGVVTGALAIAGAVLIILGIESDSSAVSILPNGVRVRF